MITSARNKGPQAFSLLDLVVSLATVALLVLLLAPALARTRANEQSFRCLNNLRQLTVGWRMYAEDQEGALPSAYDWIRGNFYYQSPDTTNINYLLNGQLADLVLRNPALYKCPADPSTTTFSSGITLPRVRTVSLNQMIRLHTESPIEGHHTPWIIYEKLSDVIKPRPADLFVIIEENPNYIDDAAFAATAGTIGGVSASWPEYPSILHGGGCALSFADGHSEIKLWKDPITLAGKAPPPPFLSPTNDLRWLGERTTALLY